MRRKDLLVLALLPFFIIVFLVVFFIVLSIPSDNYFDVNEIEFSDRFSGKQISIPLETKRHPEMGIPVLFKMREDTYALADRLEAISSPSIIIEKTTDNYIIIEVEHGVDEVSNALVFETSHRNGWHYYCIKGFDYTLYHEDLTLGSIYWPIHYTLESYERFGTLDVGKEYTTSATIDDFAAFYQRVCDQQGLTLDKTENTITLPTELCSNRSEITDESLIVILTFSNGTVRIDYKTKS